MGKAIFQTEIIELGEQVCNACQTNQLLRSPIIHQSSRRRTALAA